MREAHFQGDIPRNYDAALGPVLFAAPAADIAARAAALRPNRVLEIAAGTGIATKALVEALPAGTQITATDLNPPMLEIAKGKFDDESVVFAQADAMALPFDDESFDLAVCQFGAMFFPDKDLSFREVRRVLTPGGYYLFSVWDSHKHNPFGQISHEVVGRFFPSNPPQFQRLPFSYAFDPIKDSLIEAGFSDIALSVFRFSAPVPDPLLLARGALFGSPLFEQVKERNGTDHETIAQALAEAVSQAFPEGRMPSQSLVVSARA